MHRPAEKKPALTARQKEIYEFLKDKILNRGYGPTVREIGNHFGIRSPNGVMCHLKALEKKGLITRESHMSRAIQLSEPPQHRLTLRYAGRILTGSPLRPSENGDRVNFAQLFDTEGHCCLKVDDDQLQKFHICNGDHIVVGRDQQPRMNDLVVSLIGPNAVVDRYEAALNANHDIFGVIVSVIRRFD